MTKKKKALGFCNGGQELFCILFCKRKEVPIIEKKAYIGRIRWWIYEWFKVKRRSIYAQKMIDKIVKKANGISMNFMLTSYYNT